MVRSRGQRQRFCGQRRLRRRRHGERRRSHRRRRRHRGLKRRQLQMSVGVNALWFKTR